MDRLSADIMMDRSRISLSSLFSVIFSTVAPEISLLLLSVIFTSAPADTYFISSFEMVPVIRRAPSAEYKTTAAVCPVRSPVCTDRLLITPSEGDEITPSVLWSTVTFSISALAFSSSLCKFSKVLSEASGVLASDTAFPALARVWFLPAITSFNASCLARRSSWRAVSVTESSSCVAMVSPSLNPSSPSVKPLKSSPEVFASFSL